MSEFLPITKADMDKRGWDRLDFLFVSGDAYVDHPSFGPAIICRLLEKLGWRVGIIPQPDWRSTAAFRALGKPRLAVLVSAGNLDSMLSRYTAARRIRSDDDYSPGGRAGLRPERATLVYASRIRELWKDVPLVIGGIEASLRRFAHYDYWADTVRRSVLIDSKADLLVYGMGEKQIREIAAQLAAGIPVDAIRDVKGTCYRAAAVDHLWNYVEIPSYEAVKNDKQAFAEAFRRQYDEQDPIHGKTVVQRHNGEYVVQNPPAAPLTTAEMDEIYELPYRRTYHPSYEAAGGVPAIREVKFSLVSHRGCFGGCSFCAIVSHQGRIIQTRSAASVLREAEILTSLPDFKGYIHDVGGPTANFRLPACSQQAERGACRHRRCLHPAPCPNLNADHSDYLSLLRALRQLPKVKKVFIRSGIRYDYLLAEGGDEFLRELCSHHVSGQLKIAPEHVAPRVTALMGKPGKEVYLRFADAFRRMNAELGKEQYLVPYLMSSHPGSGLREAVELAEFLRDMGYHPEQVQDFIPTPGSLSTCMYYTGVNPLTGEKVYVARDQHEKRLQRALLQYRNPKNYDLVLEALTRAGRQDLIGYGEKCLIRPPRTPGRPPGPTANKKARALPPDRGKGSRPRKQKEKTGAR